ncbi:MAG: hypothetical protein RJA36_3593 [Pseudomonadota bacterium]|jgi:hypothetical protein
MPDRHTIANMALGRLGASRIQSFSDGTVQSDLCRDHYDQCVRECLEDHPWNFAEAAVALSQDATAARPDYSFSYEVPVDCLAPRWLMRADGSPAGPGYPYRIGKSKLCTDLDGAWLVYTYKAPEHRFSPLFVAALHHLLAARLAGPITETETKAQYEQALYERTLARARTRNSQQDTPEQFDTSTLIAVHHG